MREMSKKRRWRGGSECVRHRGQPLERGKKDGEEGQRRRRKISLC